MLLALSLTCIIFLTFSSIVINSYKLYEKEILDINKVQKGIIFKKWLSKQSEESSSVYISDHDGRLTFKEKDNNIIYKLVLYKSAGVPALGVEKYQIDDNILSYIEKEPILNGVVDIKINDINQDQEDNDDNGLEILLNLGGYDYSYYFLLNRGGNNNL